MVPGLKGNFDTVSIAERLVQTNQLAARPAFELAFFRTQNAVLDRMNEEIAALQKQQVFTRGTALLDVQVAKLERDLVDMQDYHQRTKSNDINAETVLDQITDLKALATSATVTEFDALKTELTATLNKLETPFFERFGAPDGLRQRKADALSQLESMAHNNFATQGDIDSVNATLDSISLDFINSRLVTDINRDMAFDLVTDTQSRISDIKQKISEISLQAQGETTEKIEAKRELFGTILTTVSLAFEASQNVTNFVAQNAVLPQKIPPGSILNLFS